ncbi:MAG: anaerobic ribonucleoside-triphosphate reductase activating protein [Clostridia bacterium]|nr:anaerobic ribonucleoside-triphosphate reductase activating protein [Clostridia bacterium]
MKLAGMQKLTLLDFPGKTACTLFTPGCNLRCPFCHNASLVTHIDPASILSPDEVLSFLKKRQGLLEGVCITGGEPLLQSDILPFMKDIKALGYAIKLDTNGTNPHLLRTVLEAGVVDYVAMDIKSSPERYSLVSGMPVDMEAIRSSVALLIGGTTPYEFRTTVVKGLHLVDDFPSIGELIRGAGHYYIQNFVDSGDLIQPGFTAFSKEELEEFMKIVAPFVQKVALRGL